MTSLSSFSLPKWQPILVDKPTYSFLNNLSYDRRFIFGFGLTTPTMAVFVLAIFLCILLEISRKIQAASSPPPSDLVDRKQSVVTDRKPVVDRKPAVMVMKYWIGSKLQLWMSNNNYKQQQWHQFFTQLFIVYEVIRSLVVKGVLDFEKEGKFI